MVTVSIPARAGGGGIELRLRTPEQRAGVDGPGHGIDRIGLDVAGPVLVGIRGVKARLEHHRIGVEAGGVDRSRGDRFGLGQNLGQNHLHRVRQVGRTGGREIRPGPAGDRHRRQRARGRRVVGGIDAGAEADHIGLDAGIVGGGNLVDRVRERLIVGGIQRAIAIEARSDAVTRGGRRAERRPAVSRQILGGQSVRHQHDIACRRAAVARGRVVVDEIVLRLLLQPRERRFLGRPP